MDETAITFWQRQSPSLRIQSASFLKPFFKTNFIITSFIIFAALYASLTAIFERSLLHPLTITQQKQQIVYPPQLSLTPSNHTWEEKTHFGDFPFSSPFRQCRQLNSYFFIFIFLVLFHLPANSLVLILANVRFQSLSIYIFVFLVGVS